MKRKLRTKANLMTKRTKAQNQILVPLEVLALILEFCSNYPNELQCRLVCTQWYEAFKFVPLTIRFGNTVFRNIEPDKSAIRRVLGLISNRNIMCRTLALVPELAMLKQWSPSWIALDVSESEISKQLSRYGCLCDVVLKCYKNENIFDLAKRTGIERLSILFDAVYTKETGSITMKKLKYLKLLLKSISPLDVLKGIEFTNLEFLEITTNNPQIDKIVNGNVVNIHSLKSLSVNVPDIACCTKLLEKLHFESLETLSLLGLVEDTPSLNNFHKLKTLKISTLRVPGGKIITNILRQLERFKNLEVLKFNVIDDDNPMEWIYGGEHCTVHAKKFIISNTITMSNKSSVSKYLSHINFTRIEVLTISNRVIAVMPSTIHMVLINSVEWNE